MSRTSSLILLGVLIVLTPFSGFPIDVRNLLTVVFGIAVFGIGLSLRAHDVARTEVEANVVVNVGTTAE